MGVQGAPPKASPSLPVICPPRDRSVHRLVLRTKPSLCWLVAVASGTRYLGGGPDGNEGLSEESGSLMDGGASRGGGRTVAWPSPTVRPRAGCCPRPQFPACATGQRGRTGLRPGGRRVSASRWPSARALVLVTSRRGVLAHALSPSPLPGHEASRTIQFVQKRQGCLGPHRQQCGQTDMLNRPSHTISPSRAERPGWAGPRWGPAVLLLRASSWACEGLVCHAGRGRGPPGVPGAWSWPGPPPFQRIGVLSDSPGWVPCPRDALWLWSGWARALAPSA